MKHYIVTLSKEEYNLVKNEMMNTEYGFRPEVKDEVTFVGLACALLAAKEVEE